MAKFSSFYNKVRPSSKDIFFNAFYSGQKKTIISSLSTVMDSGPKIVVNSPLYYLDQVKQELNDIKLKVVNHNIYKHLDDMQAVRTFMESHVFSVWDFMWLVKRMQQDIGTFSNPWVPNPSNQNLRFIYEILLGEETDSTEEIQRLTGCSSLSHLELYLKAMKQMDASTKHIEQALDNVKNGKKNIFDGIDCSVESGITSKVQQFTKFTSRVVSAESPAHYAASAFLLGREHMIPEMFEQVEKFLPRNEQTNLFWLYLDRHIEVDGKGDENGVSHQVLGDKLLINYAQTDENIWQDILNVGRESLNQRYDLWTGIMEQIQFRKKIKLSSHNVNYKN